MAFGHVLSPQFVLWLAPFPLLVPGRRGVVAAALVVAALVLTHVEFPWRYWDYALRQEQGATLIVLARDLVLAALYAALLAPLSGRAARRGRAPRAEAPAPRVLVVERLVERVHHPRVELRAGAAAELGERLARRAARRCARFVVIAL